MSGRMTATLPLPRAARGLSVVMAEKELLSELTEICGTGAELEPPPLEPDGVLLLELPHAASASAALAAIATPAADFVTECKKTTSLTGGTCRDMPDADPCRAPIDGRRRARSSEQTIECD